MNPDQRFLAMSPWDDDSGLRPFLPVACQLARPEAWPSYGLHSAVGRFSRNDTVQTHGEAHLGPGRSSLRYAGLAAQRWYDAEAAPPEPLESGSPGPGGGPYHLGPRQMGLWTPPSEECSDAGTDDARRDPSLPRAGRQRVKGTSLSRRDGLGRRSAWKPAHRSYLRSELPCTGTCPTLRRIPRPGGSLAYVGGSNGDERTPLRLQRSTRPGLGGMRPPTGLEPARIHRLETLDSALRPQLGSSRRYPMPRPRAALRSL